MVNFLQFIDEDIKSKKTLFSTMPTSTKTNKRKFNKKIEEIREKYQEYDSAVKKYLNLKSKSFDIKDDRNTSSLTEAVADLENIKFILNPTNTYFEKMGFDTLLYQLGNYQDLKFTSLKNIISDLLDKFNMAGYKVLKEDFDYTYYVNKFMSEFLDIRNSGADNYERLTEIFEKIYWENPELIKHLELNFRKIIRKNEKKFIDYINKLQTDIRASSRLDYQSCIDKLTVAYRDLNFSSKENISDIIEIAKKGEIDVNNLFEDSKTRITTFSNLMIDQIDLKEENLSNKFYDNVEKLKSNALEYGNYVKFSPLIIDFKNKYLTKQMEVNNKNNGLKDIENKISQAEKRLTKLNKKLLVPSKLPFLKKDNDNKNIKFESIKLANELNDLYKTFKEEYFKTKVLSKVSESFTVTDLLHLYYSFDYYKKSAIKDVYKIENYDEIVTYSDSFDLFAMNPTNVIVCAAALYEEANIAKVIINKYRLLNINITDEDINPDDLNNFIEKLDLILRIREIDKSKLSVEKLWFIVQVHKINSMKK